jgi:hypothetical protein
VLCKQDIVAKDRMPIERNMGGIDRDIVLDQESDPLVCRAADVTEPVPKHSMMDDQEIGAGRYHSFDGSCREIHRSHNSGDFSPILKLETIQGSGMIRSIFGF